VRGSSKNAIMIVAKNENPRRIPVRRSKLALEFLLEFSEFPVKLAKS